MTPDVNALWPAMRQALADRPDDLAMLDAMEAEHAAIDPWIVAIDAALADRDAGPQRLGDLAGALATNLTGHLTHEEREALPLIGATPDQGAVAALRSAPCQPDRTGDLKDAAVAAGGRQR